MAAYDSFRAIGYPVRVHAGPDALARLSDEVDRTGAKRGFVVCGQSVARRTGLLTTQIIPNPHAEAKPDHSRQKFSPIIAEGLDTACRPTRPAS